MDALKPLPDLSFDVTDADFESAVIERSMSVPVLLDCWAEWCGPCKVLKPVLEKVVPTYEGRVVLAKLDTEANPQIAALLGLRSIPHVVLFKGGRPVAQFTGALPESQVRAFLDQHVAPLSKAEKLRREARELPPAEAAERLARALDAEPGNADVALELAQALLAGGQAEAAREVVEAVPEPLRGDGHKALLARLDFAAARPPGDEAALRARIDANPRDHDARFELAALLAHGGDFPGAFEQLLETVLRDKADARERARAKMVEWFTLCPDAGVVDRARRRLSMYLN